jgi:glycerol-3-phosphate O-acyltransferase
MPQVLLVHEAAFAGDEARMPELAALAALQAQGIAVAPLLVISGAVEELFYRSNNLAPQLLQLFAAVDHLNPDEDELEDVAPEAVRLLMQNYLLEEVIDGFYDAVALLPRDLRIRRPGSAGAATQRGRAALLALKRVWAADWTVDALFDRLSATGRIELAERPVLLHATDAPVTGTAMQRRVAAVLGRSVGVNADAAGNITRLDL